jgi:hypothetical protein
MVLGGSGTVGWLVHFRNMDLSLGVDVGFVPYDKAKL